MAYYGEWAPYVTVGDKKAKALKKMEKLQKKGKRIYPVEEFRGRTIAKSFWGNGWCEHLESFSDFSNRLPRGSRYVKNGSVVHLDILPGEIEAWVAGSEPYEVTVSIEPLPDKTWERIKEQCTGEIGSILELLQGNISKDVMAIVSNKNKGLFPKPKEISFRCSCPDSASMCKHIAAVLYGVGRRLDTEPELLFTLRNVDPQELIEGGVALPDFETQSELDGEDLGDLFGIDIDLDDEPQEVPASTTKKASKKKTKAKTSKKKAVAKKKASTKKKAVAKKKASAKKIAGKKTSSKKKVASSKKRVIAKKKVVGQKKATVTSVDSQEPILEVKPTTKKKASTKKKAVSKKKASTKKKTSSKKKVVTKKKVATGKKKATAKKKTAATKKKATKKTVAKKSTTRKKRAVRKTTAAQRRLVQEHAAAFDSAVVDKTMQRMRPTGASIQRLRGKLKLSIAEFAEELGVTVATVYRWEASEERLTLRSRPLRALAVLNLQAKSK
ncbi:MAG: helix-turn-helix domain-containing protein [Deltaproteobacteria bacterium]|nr:MAG: helix-turn-helix domain-containing protein [Deltaproteobacteria bacterium]